MDADPVSIPDVPLLLVSGKGGVGKSSVAVAVAVEQARRGRHTLLVHMAPEGSRHPVLEAPLSATPVEVLPNLWLARLDARLALKEYLRRRTTFGRLYERVVDHPAVGRFVDALPAFDELMSLGKLYDLVAGSGSRHERVVFDAPATGHCRTLLRVPATTAGTLAGGPIRDSARRIEALLTDPQRCRLLIVTLPEEAPVREALELLAFATGEVHVALAPLVLNRLRSSRFAAHELEPLAALPDAGVQALLAALRSEEEVAARQHAHANELRAHTPLLTLPDVAVEAVGGRARVLREALAEHMA